MLLMWKNIKKWSKEFFTPKLPEPRFTLRATQRSLGDNEAELNHQDNVETMMIADLKLQWEAQRRTLVLVQRTALIAILALVVSILTLAVTILHES